MREIRLDVGSMQLSGLLAEPDTAPRGLILALHGGGARASYWQSPVSPEAGLLHLGAVLGWRVLSIDRPGYGASTDRTSPGLAAREQGPLLEAALAEVGTHDLPVVLAGHSLGAIVATHMAATARPAGLVALAIGGVPIAYTAEQTAEMSSIDVTGSVTRRSSGRPRPQPTAWFGPTGTWDERLTEAHNHRVLFSHTPVAEFVDAREAPSTLPLLLARVQVPVQFAVAEHEKTTATPEVLLEAAADALITAPVLDLLVVRDSGHNMSLSNAARSYHLRLLSFAEMALTGHTRAGRNLIPPRDPVSPVPE